MQSFVSADPSNLPVQAEPGTRRYIQSNFAIFAILYATWALIDLSTVAWLRPKPSILLVPLAILVILRPNNVKLVMAMMAAELFNVVVKAPFYVNISFVAAIFAVTLFVGALVFTIRNRRLPKTAADLEADCFSAMRVGTIMVWFFAVLHKTNWDFLTPSISCAIIHYRMLCHTLPFLPSADNETWAHVVIWATWAAEFSVFATLTLGWAKLPSRKILTAGLFLALAFHYVMSFNGHQFFSTMALACYIPFLPKDFYRTLNETLDRAKKSAFALPFSLACKFVIVLVLLFGVEMLIATVMKFRSARSLDKHAAMILLHSWTLFNFVAAPVVMIGYTYLTFQRRKEPNELAGGSPKWWAYPVFIVVVFSSLCPYLGLKTGNSFAMFSNLLTESHRWNHVFLPQSMQIFHFQDNMVTVNRTNIPDTALGKLADGKFQVVEFEFRRMTADVCGDIKIPIELDYEINGTHYFVPDAHKLPELRRGNGAVLEKLMQFRQVPNSPHGICLH